MKQVLVRMCPRDTLNLDQGNRTIVGLSTIGEEQPYGGSRSSKTTGGDLLNKSQVTVLVSF